MKKKNRVTLIVTIALALVALVLILNNRFSTLKPELKDFAVNDTASVTKIFLADKAGRKVTLEKISPGNWTVNGTSPARKEAVDLLLYTMMKLEVKNPVAKAGTDNVLKNLAANGIKVEIYQNNELSKTYYVGGATQDQLGTFMLIEHSSSPFVMFLPGHNGYLTSRYFTDEASWKSRLVFRYKPGELRSISVSYPLEENKSFVLSSPGKLNFTIRQPQGKETITLSDTLAVYNYLSGFGNVQFELVVNEISKTKKDSVLASIPLAILEVQDITGTTRLLKFFGLEINERSMAHLDDAGNPLKYDPDRMYALIDGKDFVLVQHYVFDKILKTFGDFVKQAPPPVSSKEKKGRV